MSDKLVLTPAQRIDADEQAEPAQKPADAAEDNVLVLDAAKRADRAGLEATIAELEAAVTVEPEDADTNTDTAADNAFAAEGEADALSDEATDDADAEADAEDDMPIGAVDDQSSEIDQDALREMVVQIVREELGGEMGERITRNVRKLVRREINRILLSRDLS